MGGLVTRLPEGAPGEAKRMAQTPCAVSWVGSLSLTWLLIRVPRLGLCSQSPWGTLGCEFRPGRQHPLLGHGRGMLFPHRPCFCHG